MEDIEQSLPFKLLGIDSDNGSEFINYHLKAFCEKRKIQFTRGRPYKKDDNAHIEQKNWTHVRKILGYLRYDSPTALEAINGLYKNELGWMMNLFQPSVKLVEKTRVGSRLKRTYDRPTSTLSSSLRSSSKSSIVSLSSLNARHIHRSLPSAICNRKRRSQPDRKRDLPISIQHLRHLCLHRQTQATQGLDSKCLDDPHTGLDS